MFAIFYIRLSLVNVSIGYSPPPIRNMRIAIIGAGWNGCHLAIELTKAGHDITVLEKRSTILSGCSGIFGIRLHRGPHYPRSKPTREGCHADFERFCKAYPEIIKHPQDSIYAYGERDAEGCPSKVSADAFEEVCFETKECQKIDAEAKAIQEVASAYDLDEPVVAVGTELRSFFGHKLAVEGVKVLLDVEVQRIRRRPYGPFVVFYTTKSSGGQCTRQTKFLDAGFVVNATGYQSLTPNLTVEARPLGFDVVYQACIAFLYEDTAPSERPISFIVMDGWFPCVMPYIDDGPATCDPHRKDSDYSNDEPQSAEAGSTQHLSSPPRRHYILTHGSYTILGSFPRPEQAQHLLDRVLSPFPSSSPSSHSSFPSDSTFTDTSHPLSQLREAAQSEICRFWPLFRGRFQYRGCQGSVLAKLRTKCEFRSSVVFAQDRVIYVFPGKISNIFRACDDVKSLIAAGASSRENLKGKGREDRATNGRHGSDGSDNYGSEKEEERVVVVDGYSVVDRAMAEVSQLQSRQGAAAAAAAATSDDDIIVGTKKDMQAVDEGQGPSTCDLQTFDRLRSKGFSSQQPAAVALSKL